MRFSTRARACPFLVCICAHARCFHTRLFSAWERAAWDKSVQESEREEQKCQRGRRRESRRRRRARIGWWRESGLGLCQMTLAKTRPPRRWSREYFYHYRDVSFLRHGEASSSGWNSRGDSQRSQVTRRWREHRELRNQRRITRPCAYILYFVILFRRNIPREFLFRSQESLYWQMTKEYTRELRKVEKFSFNETSRTAKIFQCYQKLLIVRSIKCILIFIIFQH